MKTNHERQFHQQILEMLNFILKPEEVTIKTPFWIPVLQGLKVNTQACSLYENFELINELRTISCLQIGCSTIYFPHVAILKRKFMHFSPYSKQRKTHTHKFGSAAALHSLSNMNSKIQNNYDDCDVDNTDQTTLSINKTLHFLVEN